MPRWVALVPGVLAALLVGCAGGQSARPGTWLDRCHVAQRLLAPDGVAMDIILLQRPLGDAYVNHELWGCTDEQVVAPEHAATVEDNGFRVGQVVGMPPGKLQALLSAERYC